MVGLEREKNAKPAGFRTNILVALGAALIMIVSIKVRLLFDDPQVDPGRIAAQVVSGVGFLGAGTIIREGFTVKGLTTAAGIWAVSGIGLAAGAGFYVSGVTAAILAVLVLNILNKIESKVYGEPNKKQLIRIKAAYKSALLKEVNAIMEDNDLNIENMEVKSLPEGEVVELIAEIDQLKQTRQTQLLISLLEIEEVSEIKTENFA